MSSVVDNMTLLAAGKYQLRNKGQRTEEERDKCSADGRRPGRTNSVRLALFPGPDAIWSGDNPQVPGQDCPAEHHRSAERFLPGRTARAL